MLTYVINIVTAFPGLSNSGQSRHNSLAGLFGLALVVFLCYACFRIFFYPFLFSPFRHLPEPDGAIFPWAHASQLKNEHNGAPFRRWVQHTMNDGLIRFRVLFNQERLLLTTPDTVKEVLVNKPYDFMKPPQPSFLFRELLGNGVLVAEGAEHKRQRKALMPSFSYRHIKDLYPLFWSKARQSTDRIAEASRTPGSMPQLAYDWASRVTLDIIGYAAMGYDFNSVDDPNGEIVTVYRRLFESEPPHFRWTVIGLLMPLQLVWKLPLPQFKDLKRAADAIRDLGYSMVSRKRSDLKDGKVDDVDILTVAIKSNEFTDDDIVNQLMTFLAAGHETTASAITWALYILCQHREIQTRLRNEVRAGLPSLRDQTTTISSVQIDHLPYLNAVCNEVLRFMPSVPTTVRDAVVDTSINNQFIPKGTRIFISPWAMNINPQYWGASSSDFSPDRWLEPNMANAGGAKTNFANLTFLHGPRSCIGKDFAKAEFLCLLAAWIGRFEVSWKDGKALSEDIMGWVTIHPRHKLPVMFREIEGW